MLNVELRKILLKKRSGYQTLLKNISFSLASNQVYTIVGKNGTGKSTLIKSLTGLTDIRFYKIEGEVYFESRDIYSFDKEELIDLRKHKIKYVFQDAINSFDPLKKFKYYFTNLTTDENNINNLLDYFALPEKEKLYMLYPYEVSGGMAQRISLTLALLTEPRVIILDEPTSGIDSPISNLILLKLRDFVSLKKNIVLLVTQDLLLAKKISDKIAFLNEGTLSGFYQVSDFFNQNGNEVLTNFINSHSKLL